MDRYFPAFVTLHRHGDLEGAAAFAAWRQKETIVTRSKEDILARIQVALASRAAEELFLDVNLSGVTGDLQSATANAAMYVGAYGMDGTLTSGIALGGMEKVHKAGERIEAVLQSQFKAVKHLFQEHSEAVMAVAEALIEQDELVADEIKQLIDEADARRVAKKVIYDFEALLGNGNGNGNSNGKNGNGHLLIGSSGSTSDTGNSGSHGITIPRQTDSTTSFNSDGGTSNTNGMQLPPEDDDRLFFMGG